MPPKTERSTFYLTRRDFLTLAGAAAGGAAFFFTPPSPNTPLSQPAPSPTETGISSAIDRLIFGTPEQPALGDRIIQTGIREMEIDGKRYALNVDKQATAELIVSISELFGKPDLAPKVEKWLMGNDLEVEIYPFSTSPISYIGIGTMAYTLSPILTGPHQAYIGISDKMVVRLFHRLNDSNWKQPKDIFDPLIVFPHEGLHLVDYIRSPLAFIARFLARAAIDFTAGIGISAVLDSREMIRRTGNDRFVRFIKFASMASFIKLTDSIVDEIPNLGTHGVIFDGALKKLMTDPKINELAKKWLTFTPTE